MAATSYPNIQLLSTASFTLQQQHNGVTFTSTLGSSVNLVVTAALSADFWCWAVQDGAGAIGVTAGSGATANAVGGATGTSGQYAAMKIMGVTDGNFVFTGSLA